jgi:hypothetical protein
MPCGCATRKERSWQSRRSGGGRGEAAQSRPRFSPWPALAWLPHHTDSAWSHRAACCSRPRCREAIREGDAYAEVRVGLCGSFATAQSAYLAKVNVGDPVWPAPIPLRLLRLLGGERRAGLSEHEVSEVPLPIQQAGSPGVGWVNTPRVTSLPELPDIARPEKLRAGGARQRSRAGANVCPLAQSSSLPVHSRIGGQMRSEWP